jgi:protein arginine kinase activator
VKCDLCENEATVRELTRKNGVKFEKHLCERCAREQGITLQSQAPLEVILKQFVVSASAPPEQPPKPRAATGSPACPTCGLSFTDFKQSGTLGCGTCYIAFESLLAGLLERAHEGACLHVGKAPKRGARTIATPGTASAPRLALSPEERVQKLQALRRQLEEAVKGEQYERAAKLRDELRRFGEGEGSGHSSVA